MSENIQSNMIFTNRDGNSLFNKFANALPDGKDFLEHFDALVGFFRSTGYFQLRPYLENIPEIRILVGINVDVIATKYAVQGQLNIGQADECREQFIENLCADIQNDQHTYSKEIQEGILQFVQDIAMGKLKMKIHPSKNIHAKFYILRPKNGNKSWHGSVITGSSNFTEQGLGTHKKSNYEFNVELKSDAEIIYATKEFEDLWQEAIDIRPEDVEKVKKRTFLNDEYTPFELYIKLLIEHFGNSIDYDPTQLNMLLPKHYMQLAYQAEAANEGYDKLMKYNGFFLADVVGLGKTIVACMIIKKFIIENGSHTKILIVYPPTLEDNWKETVNDFGIENNTEYISVGSLHKILDPKSNDYSNPDVFDMIVIDEAHKFRNDTSSRYEKLQRITKADRKIAGKNGDRRKKVILISATPLNNHPSDIANQLYLFQDKRNANLPTVRNLEIFFQPLKDQFEELKQKDTDNYQKIHRIFDTIRNTIIEPLVIRRSRADLENDEVFKQDLKKQGIVFPQTNPPQVVEYLFDNQLSELFDTTISMLISRDSDLHAIDGVGYYYYRTVEFLVDPTKQKQHGRNAQGTARQLEGLMKTLLIKRLESSFFAFKNSLTRFLEKTEHLIKMFENDKVYVAAKIDINKWTEEDKDDLLDEIVQKKGGHIYQASDFQSDFLEHLKNDRQKLKKLSDQWEAITYDPKLDKFMDDFKTVFLNKKINPFQKIVVFSESKDTIEYLAKELEKQGIQKIITVTSENRQQTYPTIVANFDANYEQGKQKNDYDFIFTTEVLSEGINLHRANVVVNYDVPWNSTKLMQRIGRVNRIGTKATHINVFNFAPTDKSDNQIKLTNTAIRKLQAFHTTFGEDYQIYSQQETLREANLHRKEKIEYGINDIRDEANQEHVFRQELRAFKEKYPQQYNKIKKLPQQARTTRQINESLTPHVFKNASVIYIKSEEHPGVFYKTSQDNTVSALPIVEALKLFKADRNEQSTKLPDHHYQQVECAKQFFKSKQQEQHMEAIKTKDLSTVDKQAINNLIAYKQYASDEAQKIKITYAQDTIRKGTYKKLASSINRFFKNNKINDPEKMIANLCETVLNNMNVSPEATESKEYDEPKFTNPQVVISESFI